MYGNFQNANRRSLAPILESAFQITQSQRTPVITNSQTHLKQDNPVHPVHYQLTHLEPPSSHTPPTLDNGGAPKYPLIPLCRNGGFLAYGSGEVFLGSGWITGAHMDAGDGVAHGNVVEGVAVTWVTLRRAGMNSL